MHRKLNLQIYGVNYFNFEVIEIDKYIFAVIEKNKVKNAVICYFFMDSNRFGVSINTIYFPIFGGSIILETVIMHFDAVETNWVILFGIFKTFFESFSLGSIF